MKYKETKQCKHCGEAFTRPDSYTNNNVWQKKQFCSRACRGLSDRKSVEKECKSCNKKILVMPYELSGKAVKKYCSIECRSTTRKLMKVTEETRKKLSEAQKARTDVRVSLSGEKHWNWKGGLGTKRHQEMARKEYKEWRKCVFERDNYTCQICEQYGGVLHADHIQKWSANETLRYAVENGRTLCVPCHYYITFKRKMMPGQRWCNYMARERG